MLDHFPFHCTTRSSLKIVLEPEFCHHHIPGFLRNQHIVHFVNHVFPNVRPILLPQGLVVDGARVCRFIPHESARLPSQARYFLACLNQWLSTKNQASPLTRVLSASLCRSVLNLASLCSLVSSCA